jgi:phage tail-like protein
MPYLVAPFTFVLEIDGLEFATFSRCSGVGSETEVVEFKGGGDLTSVRKVPGATTWADLVLGRPLDGSTTLWDWRRQVVEGDIDAARRSGSIVVKDSRQGEVARWDFQNGWPSQYRAHLDASAGEAAVEELVICHEGLQRA